MTKHLLLQLLSLAVCHLAYAQKIARFEIDLKENKSALNIPLHIALDNLSFESDSTLVLSEVVGNRQIPVPFQISEGNFRTLNWLVEGNSSRNRVYELSHGTPKKFDQMEATMLDGAITLHLANRNFLQYWYKMVYPPAGIDSIYKRNAFVHPLWTPHGQILTNIQPPDHYHHYGIFNPWTHVLFEGDTIDFWNLAKREGTVRFGKFIAVNSGPVFSEFKALHEHVVLNNKFAGEKVAINELQTIRVYRPEPGQEYYYLDINIELNCAGASPVRILEYRYGGLGWRATEKWNKTNVEVLTSEGKHRKESDDSRGRWVVVQGPLGQDYGGAALLSYPSNYNHPEPLRIWPESAAGGTGQMFTNFAPTKDRDWLLLPGKTYVLKYRFIVFNGHFTKNRLEEAWRNYAHPPKIRATK